VHPVLDAQRAYFKNQEILQNFALSNVYGSHMVLRLQMEKKILSSIQRLPALRSEFFGYDVVTHRDEEISFGDLMTKRGEAEEFPKDIHELMESKLKL